MDFKCIRNRPRAGEFLHTLCRAVTLIFVLLTLNFYSSLGVTPLNSAQNLIEIE